ncbi:MAG: ABC-F family ATP-binding cassette domain-containing protein [Streptococcaceae bacterium]|jgi:ATP-binding cassette subfamily F protein uup|nr:ABC-F family ATP-binding cassette domain-containing protein [Streptococcaceae bacterium]
MPDFKVENLTKTVADKAVFEAISFLVHPLDRIGLLGVNGTGKTTLLNVLAGVTGFDGDVSPFEAPSNFTITYLAQEPDFDESASILDTVLDEKLPQMQAIAAYEKTLTLDFSVASNLTKMEKAQSEMDARDAWQIEADVKAVLTQLKLPDVTSKIGSLSGGQKRRVQLAQALVNPSDLLLLDEPTNHLDVETITWLQNYLKTSKRTVLFVTHDRYFLDAVATRIFELDHAALKEYQGNYTAYLEKKAADEEREAASAHKAQQLYKSELVWIRKSPQARGTKQQARIDRFNDLKDSLKTENAAGDLDMGIASQRLGKKVIELKSASFSYPDRPIFKDFSLIVQPHARIGVVGDNGVGKSTLLNIIAGDLQLTSGRLDIGETVNIGYFSQEIRGLDENKRMITFLEETASAAHLTTGENISIVNLLEQFLFPRSTHGVQISKLSGGEKKRLYLLKILLLQPNVLLLDEPTNDLDIATLTVLEHFLAQFTGTVITVSHDRYFQDKVSNELLAFENGEINHYFGAYSDYLSVKFDENQNLTKNASENLRQISKNPEKAVKNRMTYAEKQEWATIEADIDALETRSAEIEREMNENASDSARLIDLQHELDDLTARLSAQYARWEYLSEKDS